MQKFCFGVLTCVLWIASSHWGIKPIFENSRPELVRAQYFKKFENYLLSVQSFDNALDDSERISQQKLQNDVRDLRLKYKAIEPLLAYFFPSENARYLNGAPLPKLEPNVPELVVIPPGGLQMLDELAYATDFEKVFPDLAEISHKLRVQSEQLGQVQGRYLTFSDRNVLEACRMQLIRAYTLGLTGFDTPGSANGIEETVATLEAVSEILSIYHKLAQRNAKEPYDRAQELIADAQQYLLENDDFDTLDRLHFLKSYLNPSYAALLDFHLKTGIETVFDVQQQLQGVNYAADNLFADDFLSAHFYAGLSIKDYNAAKVALGKMLFFDESLSEGKNQACASCHQPEYGFAEPRAKSSSADGFSTLERNAPTLLNACYSTRYFHDLRALNVQSQMEHVVYNEAEFNTTFERMANALKKKTDYVFAFQKTFPHLTDPISKPTIQQAIASYLISLKALDSPFDHYVRDEIDKLDPSVVRGYNLFMGKAACGTCHFAPIFNGTVPPTFAESESEILGVPTTSDTLSASLDLDLGRYGNGMMAEASEIYKHSFKTPTIRNIELTAPYMHNGVYETLEEVMDFYNKGGGIGLGYDVPYQTLPDAPLNLTKDEISDIIAFMKSLTDRSAINSSSP